MTFVLDLNSQWLSKRQSMPLPKSRITRLGRGTQRKGVRSPIVLGWNLKRHQETIYQRFAFLFLADYELTSPFAA